MNEINFLTENDIAYFERLEKEGKAIIVRIDPKKLLSLDLKSLESRASYSLKEVQEWIKENQAEFNEFAEKSKEVRQNNDAMETELENRVMQVLMEEEITEDKAALIMEAIESNLNDDEILALLNKEFSAELIDRILSIL